MIGLIFNIISLLLLSHSIIWEIRFWFVIIISFFGLNYLNVDVWGILFTNNLYCDSISGILIVLTLWISGLIFLASYYSVNSLGNINV